MSYLEFNKILKEYEKLYKDFSTEHYNIWKLNVIQFGKIYGKDEVCWFFERTKAVNVAEHNRTIFILNEVTKILLPMIIAYLTVSLTTNNNSISIIIVGIMLMLIALIGIIRGNECCNKKYVIQEKFYDDCLDILRNQS